MGLDQAGLPAASSHPEPLQLLLCHEAESLRENKRVWWPFPLRSEEPADRPPPPRSPWARLLSTLWEVAYAGKVGAALSAEGSGWTPLGASLGRLPVPEGRPSATPAPQSPARLSSPEGLLLSHWPAPAKATEGSGEPSTCPHGAGGKPVPSRGSRWGMAPPSLRHGLRTTVHVQILRSLRAIARTPLRLTAGRPSAHLPVSAARGVMLGHRGRAWPGLPLPPCWGGAPEAGNQSWCLTLPSGPAHTEGILPALGAPIG